MMATSDIDSLLRETDQFLAQHNLGQSSPSPPPPPPRRPLPCDNDDSSSDGDRDNDPDLLNGNHVDRLLRDTDSLLRDISKGPAQASPPPTPPRSGVALRSDSDSSPPPPRRTNRLTFDRSLPSDNDVANLADEVSSRPSLLRPSPIRLSTHSGGAFDSPSFESLAIADESSLNRTLTRCGFPCFDRLPTVNDLSKALMSVLTQYEVKGDLVQNLLDQQNREKSQSGSQAEFLESANRSLNAKLKEAQRMIESLSAANHDRRRPSPDTDANDELKRLTSKNHSLKYKISQLENDLRKKEIMIEEMQERIGKFTAKESSRRQQDGDLFKKLFDRAPRPSSAKDSRTLEIIGAFEAQRVRMQEEIDMLSGRLTKVTDPKLNRYIDDDRSHQVVEQLRSEKEKLIEQLDQRPTLGQWDELQHDLKTVRAQLVEARSVGDIRSKLSTRELIDRDRDVHLLSLSKLEHIPQAILVEILQDVCRVLDLDDVALVVPAVKKVSKAISRIPLLQNFAREVVQITGCDSNDGLDGLKQVYRVISSWKDSMTTLGKLEVFQRDLWHKIQARNGRLSSTTSQPSGQVGSLINEQTAIILSTIDELIRTETGLLESSEAYQNLDSNVKARPDLLLNKIIQHFMQLFKVEAVEGILPAMSRLSVDLESAQNFMNAMRSTLHLEANSSVSAIMAQVQRQCGSGDSNDNPSGDGGPDDFQAIDALMRLRRVLRVENNVDVVEACRKSVDRCALYDGLFPRVDRMINRLFEILHVRHMDDIVPAIQRLAT